jgi:signal transduction histidine kinase
MKALTRPSMEGSRRSVAGLRAPGLGERPLRAAIQELCAHLRRAGIEVDCLIDKPTDELGPALSESVGRVTQEALTNVEKRAEAQRVAVSLRLGPRIARLQVSDGGRGLPESAETTSNEFGLRGMRERVEGLGGTLTLSGQSGGTRVTATLPVLSVHQQDPRDGDIGCGER